MRNVNTLSSNETRKIGKVVNSNFPIARDPTNQETRSKLVNSLCEDTLQENSLEMSLIANSMNTKEIFGGR